MENEGIWDSIVNAFESVIDQVIDAMPRIIAAFVVMLIGVFVALILARITRKIISWVEKNKHVQKAEASVGLAGTLGRLAGKFVYWVVFVIFFSAAVSVLDVPTLSDTIDKIVAFTPSVFAAAFVFAVAYLGSVVLKDLVTSSLKEVKFPYTRAVGIAVQALVLVFGLVTAAAQLGLDLNLLNNNITIIVAGFALTFAIAFGFGGRELVSSYMLGLANKPHFEEGQKVAVNGMSGKIKSLGNTAAVIETKDGSIVVSYNELVK